MSVLFWIGLGLVVICGFDTLYIFIMMLFGGPRMVCNITCYTGRPYYWLSWLISRLEDGFKMSTAIIIRIINLLLIVVGIVLMILR